MNTVDIVAVGAHPDDVELGCGGTLARWARLGRSTAIVDLTRGELGSRGTPEIRAREAAAAAALLGVRQRRNLGLPDGGIDPGSDEQRRALAAVLRELRPAILLLPATDNRHPDHSHAARLGIETVFRAGLFKLDAAGEPHRPRLVLHYMERIPFEPSVIIDISADQEQKMQAVRAYRSQFERTPGDSEPETFLTRPAFLESIEIRDRFYGDLAGFRHGEPFRLHGALPVDAALLAALCPGAHDTNEKS